MEATDDDHKVPRRRRASRWRLASAWFGASVGCIRTVGTVVMAVG
jgi:hypothetical protein